MAALREDDRDPSLEKCISKDDINYDPLTNNRNLIVFQLPRRNDEIEQVYECLTLEDLQDILTRAEAIHADFILPYSRFAIRTDNVRRNVIERRKNTFTLRLVENRADGNLYVLEDENRREVFPARRIADTADTWEVEHVPNPRFANIPLTSDSLIDAIVEDNAELVEYLLQREVFHTDALSAAVMYDLTNMVRLLLQYGVRDEQNALHIAVSNGNREIVELLLPYQREISAETMNRSSGQIRRLLLSR